MGRKKIEDLRKDTSLSKMEQRKLYAMIVFSVFVLGGIVGLFQYKEAKLNKNNSSADRDLIAITPMKKKKDAKETPPIPSVVKTPPPKEPFKRDGVFEKNFKDKTPFESPELYYYLHWINSLSQGDIVKKNPSRILFPKLWHEPLKHRSKFLHIIGTLRDFHTLALKDQKHPSNVQVIYRGIITDKHAKPFSFVVIDKDRDFNLNESVVQLYGIYAKNYTYQAMNGKTLAIPLIVGRKLLPFKNPSQDELSFNKIAYLVVGVGSFTVLLIFLLSLWYRKKDRAFEEIQRKKNREKYNKKQAEKLLKPGGEGEKTPEGTPLSDGASPVEKEEEPAPKGDEFGPESPPEKKAQGPENPQP